MMTLNNTELFHNMLRVVRQHTTGETHVLSDAELTSSQMEVLIYLSEHESVTQNELANYAKVTKGNLSQILIKMEKRDLVKRDLVWKTKYVSMTEKGQMLYQKMVGPIESYNEELLQGLTVQERQQLEHIMNKLLSSK